MWWSHLWTGDRRDPAGGLGDLEAALAVDACPVCTRAAGADERWLDHFLYEGYLEPEAMRAVARSGGPCPYHAARVEAHRAQRDGRADLSRSDPTNLCRAWRVERPPASGPRR